VLVVRSTKVSRTMLEAGPLRLVVRAGAGFNTIDVAAASRLGIHVSNCPGKNSIAVAELAFGLVLALDRRIPDNVAALRRGEWDKGGFSKARGLFGRTLGLVGLGRIGHEMAVRARGFGMPVVAWSRSLTPERAEAIGVGFMPGPEAVAAVAEVVSVHLALEPETKRLLGPAFFSAMREGAIFVNTARSELVDSAALARAVRERKVRAGLDVFAQEPAGSAEPFSDPIVREEGVYGTHHIGASTEQAQEAIAAETVRIVREFKESGRVPNVVNLARRTPATHRLIVRHLDRPGVLATVLDTLRAAQINVQEMQNVVFEGAEAAVAYIDLDRAPAPELLERCRQENTNILDTSLLPIAGR
jgi:D-3-phosphoglycerate dehydrogenase